jgi:hypothetical protein
MAQLEEARWRLVKGLLDEFPELAKRATEYLQAREKEGKGCSKQSKGLKKAVITISLVKESGQVANEAIERAILEELSKGLPRVPWLQKVEGITVKET